MCIASASFLCLDNRDQEAYANNTLTKGFISIMSESLSTNPWDFAKHQDDDEWQEALTNGFEASSEKYIPPATIPVDSDKLSRDALALLAHVTGQRNLSASA